MKKIAFIILLVVCMSTKVMLAQGDSSRILLNFQVRPTAISFDRSKDNRKLDEGNFTVAAGTRIYPRFYAGFAYDYYHFASRRAGFVVDEYVWNEQTYLMFLRYYLYHENDFWLYGNLQGGIGKGHIEQLPPFADAETTKKLWSVGAGLAYFVTPKASLNLYFNYSYERAKVKATDFDTYNDETRRFYSVALEFSYFFLK